LAHFQHDRRSSHYSKGYPTAVQRGQTSLAERSRGPGRFGAGASTLPRPEWEKVESDWFKAGGCRCRSRRRDGCRNCFEQRRISGGLTRPNTRIPGARANAQSKDQPRFPQNDPTGDKTVEELLRKTETHILQANGDAFFLKVC